LDEKDKSVMKNLISKLFFLFTLLLVAFTSKAQTTFYENFDNYIAGENLYEQTSAIGDTNWQLWSGVTDEDAIVSANLSMTPNNSLLIQSEDDIVFYPGSYTSGRWFFSGHIYVVSGHTAYFNFMHNWYDQNFEWACQVFFEANGNARFNVGGSEYNFTYNHNEWLYFSLEMDMDKDSAVFWFNDTKIHEWPWHYQSGSTSGTNKFEGVDFYGWNDGTDSALFYLDEIKISTDAIVRFEDNEVIWDGNPKPVTVKTYPPNLSYNLTYDGSATVPTEPGTYAITATITEPGYSGFNTDILTINKANASVSVTGTSATYDGTEKAVTTTTIPSGLSVDVTYNGNATVPVNAGTYVVNATINDDHYQGITTDTLKITKATADIAFSDTIQTYTGIENGVSITTTPESLGTDVLYNGSATVPVNVGTYSVVATINDANYEGSGASTFEIEKANADIVVTDKDVVYDGTEKPVTITTTPEGLSVDVTYDGSATVPADAGTYVIVATINDPNYEGTLTDTLKIAKASPVITVSDNDVVYDGTTKDISISVIPEGLSYSVTYDGSATAPTDAGIYTVVITIDELNYEGESIDNLTISPISATVNLSDLNYTYDGLEKSATVESSPEGLSYSITYDGSTDLPVGAGKYEVIVHLTETNYTGTASDTLIINKADATISLTDLTCIYNGDSKEAIVTTFPEGLTYDISYNGEATLPLNTGEYITKATVTDKNYTGSVVDTLVIEKGQAEVFLTNLACTYTGTAQGVIVTTQPESIEFDILYDGTDSEPVEAGTYLVEVVITDGNYFGGVQTAMTINKASQTISWEQDLTGLAIGSRIDLTATASSGLELVYSSGNTDVATVTGNTITVVGEGVAKITATQLGNYNYTEVSEIKNIEIQATDTEPVSDINFRYWPNPVNDILNIELSDETTAEIEIYNQAGAIVLNNKIFSANSAMDLSELASGVYILKIKVKDNSKIVKLSKR
jgi:hypothetical protein